MGFPPTMAVPIYKIPAYCFTDTPLQLLLYNGPALRLLRGGRETPRRDLRRWESAFRVYSVTATKHHRPQKPSHLGEGGSRFAADG